MRIAAIVNPIAGWKTAVKKWPALVDALGSDSSKIDVFWSEYPGHAEPLAAAARRNGYDRVLAVGGDGTLFEVLNGLWWETKGNLPSVGMVPTGTGCDYIRNFELGDKLIDKFRTAMSPDTVQVSLGSFRNPDSNGARDRVFAMVLGTGFDAEVVRIFRSGRFGSAGWHAYALSTLGALSYLKSHLLKGNIDGSPFHANALSLGTALGCCFGKRIRIAPPASPARSEFEVILAESVGVLNLLSIVFLAYFGAHYRLPWIKTARASKVEIDASPPAWIEADGELIGKTPVQARIIPRAFRFAAKGLRKPIAHAQSRTTAPHRIT